MRRGEIGTVTRNGRLPWPYRFLDKLPDSEEELRAYAISVVVLNAFDVGSAWLDARIEPKVVTDLMVRRGFAVADGLAALGLRGEENYIARKLGLIQDKRAKTLGKSKTSPDKLLKIHKDLQHLIDSFSSGSEDHRGKVEGFRSHFATMALLLGHYLGWDSKQVPAYVGRERFSRVLFEPIQIVFKELESEDKIKGYTIAQLGISMHKSSVGSLSLWTNPIMSKKGDGFKAEDILKVAGNPEDIQIRVALPQQISKMLQEFKYVFSVKFERKSELDAEANATDIAKLCEIQYKVWEGGLADTLGFYVYLVHKFCLELMNKDTTEYNLNTICRAGMFGYRLVYLYDLGKKVDDPFDEVVKSHPRQTFAIVAGHEYFRFMTFEKIKDLVVDISPDKRISWMFSNVAMLMIFSSGILKKLQELNESRILFFPLAEQIGDAATFEMLCYLRQLLDGYDYLLSDVLEARASLDNLVNANKKIAYGLEEIHAVRHARYASVMDWWSLAEQRLGIDELDRAVKEKLEQAHRIIVTKREEQLNKRLWYIAVIAAVLTLITVVAGFKSVWEFLQTLWKIIAGATALV